MRGAAGGLLGQTPFVCGGYYYDDANKRSYSKACYSLQENGTWSQDQTAVLSTTRAWNAAPESVVINNQLVMVGGFKSWKDGRVLSTIEVASPNTKTRILPINLPKGLQFSCLVPWDNETFMVIGGSGFSKKTYFASMKNSTLVDGPPLIMGRMFHACNEIVVNGEAFIVVTGGHVGGTIGLGPDLEQRLVEVLSKTSYTKGWVKGDLRQIK